HQIDNGTNGLVPGGTTGESPTLSHAEHREIIKICVRESKDRIPIMAGTGSNSTEEAIDLTRFAEKAGAKAALIVTPYYNKPTQEGLYQHYKAINNKCGIPIFIYNIPGRSVIDMSVDTMARLFELKNIAGVKDATGDLNRIVQQRKKLGKNFIQFTGEDSNALEFKLRGGVGCISVTANVAPKLCSEMQTLLDYKSDKLIFQRAKEINKLLKPLHDLMFIETNPAPVKYAVSLLKLCSKDLRLPMVTITKKNQIRIKNLLKKLSLI
ncbi:MAG: 4-hydroxy-tetrahydrodipicolinate synthase, partial [Proteobacteria bacterium]|nr:4-hydroxy-tetrahydrodipicolinate synthase [Pseudomonadota bacterium]